MVRRSDLERMANEIRLLRSALEVYADQKSWSVENGEWVGHIGPNIARDALQMPALKKNTGNKSPKKVD